MVLSLTRAEIIVKAPHAHLSKRVLLGRGIHTFIRSISFPSPTDVGLTFHPPKGAQRLRWHTGPGSSSDTIFNSPNLPIARYCLLCGFHAPPHGFAFDKSRNDSQSSSCSLIKTRLTRERSPKPFSILCVTNGDSGSFGVGVDTQSSGGVGTNTRRLMVNLKIPHNDSIGGSNPGIDVPAEGILEEEIESHERSIAGDPMTNPYRVNPTLSDDEEVEDEVMPEDEEAVDDEDMHEEVPEETNFFIHGQPSLTQLAISSWSLH
ncbi:hypothetical protein PIB30_060622 [Stylosanthes scabra]|uniref:Uncharacterized protein n=1 Tax=Stylosanthes scabra TaxID=79078 RepID=A0ABU6WIY1_9FABA|nr:hypothetical protein [Stylosanthes scabra]